MITHNEPLKDNLTDLINIITVKANQYNDAELHELVHDVDWMVKHKILAKAVDVEFLQKQAYDEGLEVGYDDGYDTGYEEAKEAMLNAL